MNDKIEGGHVLFKLGSWEIHALFEDSEWVEIFHHCKKWDPITPLDDKVKSSYQLPGDTSCPGCDAIQPDEIQAIEQMHNMDRPTRQYGMSVVEMLKRDYERMYRQVEREMCITGDGVNG